MPCGCTSACGCIVVGDGVSADVVREGDTFTVSAIPVIIDVADTPCVTLAIDDEKILTADLVLVETDTVDLECTESGLEANVKIDPDSTADVTVSEDGIRIDVPAAEPAADTGEPGDMLWFTGLGGRANHIDADGDDASRVTYPDLWDAYSLLTTTGTRTMGSDIIDGLSSTRFLRVGTPIEATDFGSGTTVVSGTQIQVSSNALTSGVGDTEVRGYPYGDGDGTSTFGIPNLNGAFPRGYDHAGMTPENVGATGGAETVALSVGELAAHDHNVAANDAGHDHPGTTDPAGSHGHGPGTAGRSFVTADTPTQVTVASGGDYTIVVSNAGDANDGKQLNNANTDTEGDHTHPFTTDTADADINVTEDSVGSGDAHENLPPYFVGRWMVHT